MTITFTFEHELNASLQIGDALFYCVVLSGSVHTANTSNTVLVGPVTGITPWDGEDSKITVNPLNLSLTPVQIQEIRNQTNDDIYILFSKDSAVNISNVTGYYAKVSLTNNSHHSGELFAISSEVTESSK